MNSCLILRIPSIITTDMILAGFVRLLDLDSEGLQETVSKSGLSDLAQSISCEEIIQNGISGWKVSIEPKETSPHRSYEEIKDIINKSFLSGFSKEKAGEVFELLAFAESKVHLKQKEEVVFHEIGSLTNVLTVCLAVMLFERLSPDKFAVSPIPVSDGTVKCRHGLLATPAPATIHLLEGVTVTSISTKEETVAPTTLALLKTLGAEFNEWPSVKIKRTERVYGRKVLPDLPSWVIFALGALSAPLAEFQEIPSASL